MKRLINHSLLSMTLLCLSSVTIACGSDNSNDEIPTTRRERNYIKEGNKNYDRKEYGQAEVAYRKALSENQSSDVARFNLASTLSHQDDEKAKSEADSLYTDIIKTAVRPEAAQRSFYNLGNKAYQGEDYAGSIEMYKNALRRDPLDDNARENLRLAQLKLQEQQQNQNQQNQDNQDQDQQDQQDKEQQQQEQNQQNQDQQNKDQQNKDQQNQDQQDQQGNKRPEQNERDKKNEQQGGMSQANAEQILKAMEKEENATRRRVEAQQKAEQEKKSKRRPVEKPW